MKFYGIFALLLIVNVECVIRTLELSSSAVTWTLQNNNGSIKVPGSVPGGVYSDLQNAGIISDILMGFNDVQTRWVAYDTWTYIGEFTVTAEDLASSAANLVLHGVDTFAFIELNDGPIGSTQNMFVRYVFDVKQHLKVGNNELKVTFESPIEVANSRSSEHFTAPICVPDVYNGECHVNQIRKMQASFSWDWGPAFPSVGLWKHCGIEFYNGAIIRTATTHLEKKDAHWYLKIIAQVESSQKGKSIEGYMKAVLSVDGAQTITIGEYWEKSAAKNGEFEVELNMTISENVVSVWWPNGYGDQPLYDLNLYLSTREGRDEKSHKHIRIGFRTLEVVEEDASNIFGDNSTAGQGLTFYFKVNGYPLFMKGSNWIPAHILPELGYDRKTVDHLLSSAKDTHMAMLRVWGGGVYESEYFYDKCDELGILIWQDFLFACSMYPVDAEFLENVKTEIEQTVIRLQHHTSIALWAGNNENEVALRGNWYQTTDFNKYKREYIKLYVDTMKPIVEGLDPTRRYLVSSPSNGLESEQEGYIAENPYSPNYGDTHYYNYLADNWNANIYPNTRFASEYGFQSLPSLKTLRTATNDENDLRLVSEFSKHRQHSPDGYFYIKKQLEQHLKLDKNDSKYFEKFVFYSQISQAMAMKTETEFYRQSQADWYTMGALYWQLNDVWQAPSWSGIEFGGKWKMLHYFSKSFFAPVLVSPRLLLSGKVDVYLINDRLVPITEAEILVECFKWDSLVPIAAKSYLASVPALQSKKQDIAIDLWNVYAKEEIFLRFSLKAEGVTSSPYNFVFPKPLKTVVGLKEPKITISVSSRTKVESNQLIKYTINIKVDTVVLYLWLDSSLDGHFEDNGFIVTLPSLRVGFTSWKQYTAEQLENSLTYQYYMH